MAKDQKKLIDFDWDKFDTILQFNPTKLMCAEILGVSESTIESRLHEFHDMTFNDYKARKMSITKLKLAQKAITMGLEGDRVMLIFSLKNISGWADNPLIVPEDDTLEFYQGDKG